MTASEYCVVGVAACACLFILGAYVYELIRILIANRKDDIEWAKKCGYRHPSRNTIRKLQRRHGK